MLFDEVRVVQISLDCPKAGLVFVHINDGSNETVVGGSHVLGDVLRDFVDTVQSLQSAIAADCCWFQEPGEIHWNFRRNGEQLEIDITDFPKTVTPGWHRGDGATVFKARTSWHNFAKQVLESFEAIETPEYERGWRFPFPKQACEKLRNAIGSIQR